MKKIIWLIIFIIFLFVANVLLNTYKDITDPNDDSGLGPAMENSSL